MIWRRSLAFAAAGVIALVSVRLWQLLDAAAGHNAKVLCSAVFISGRSLEEARAHSLRVEPPLSQVRLDREARIVQVTIAGLIRRRAVFAESQGCIGLPRGLDAPEFEPVAVSSSLPPPDSLDWPMGDRVRNDPPKGIDAGRLRSAVEAAFSDPNAHTAAFLVIYRGEIVAERYAPGIRRDTPLEGWSIGKSMAATLVGRLIQEGALRLEQPAPIAEWQSKGDSRAAITVADLLHMSSGLRCSFPKVLRYAGTASVSLLDLLWRGLPDHIRIYTGMRDVYRFAIHPPSEHPAGQVGRYRNSDPLVLGAIVRRTVEARGDEYLSWPQRALLDRIGIRHMVLETDARGNFILPGLVFGAARDWGRLGLLYLSGGLWLGERLLPAEFIRFVSTPAPAWEEPVYGGLFWLNRTDRVRIPQDAYWMGGDGEQRVTIVPSLELVVVRFGHIAGGTAATATLARALEEVVAALRGAREIRREREPESRAGRHELRTLCGASARRGGMGPTGPHSRSLETRDLAGGVRGGCCGHCAARLRL